MLYQLSYARRHGEDTANIPPPGLVRGRVRADDAGNGERPPRPFDPLEEATLHGPRLRSEQGQTMAEYGVVLAVITAGVIAAWLVFSGAIVSAILKTVALMP